MKTEVASMKRLYIIDKFLVRLPKKKRTQITNIRNEKGDITTDSIAIKRLINNITIYPHKFYSIGEIGKFSE